MEDPAGAFWANQWRQFFVTWLDPDVAEFQIPQHFWDAWHGLIGDNIRIQDPVGNMMTVHIIRDGDHGILSDDLTTRLLNNYHVNQAVRIHFKLILGDLFLMKMTLQNGEEFDYPWINNGNMALIGGVAGGAEEEDGVLSDEDV